MKYINVMKLWYSSTALQRRYLCSSGSGFADWEIYAEWFQKNFLAIANDVILLCFLPKLTHIQLPCNVAIYCIMKAELSKVTHQVKILRKDCWISKHKFPAIFKTFTAGTMNKDAISKELIQKLDK